MPVKKINMVQLAKELNLAISTVSKALQDSYEISAVTKQRVNELAKKYNYRPNPIASSLRRGKSKSIAVVIPEIANNFFSLAVEAIQTFASEKGYDVFVYLKVTFATSFYHLDEKDKAAQVVAPPFDANKNSEFIELILTVNL